jgi:hypothetical protein
MDASLVVHQVLHRRGGEMHNANKNPKVDTVIAKAQGDDKLLRRTAKTDIYKESVEPATITTGPGIITRRQTKEKLPETMRRKN